MTQVFASLKETANSTTVKKFVETVDAGIEVVGKDTRNLAETTLSGSSVDLVRSASMNTILAVKTVIF